MTELINDTDPADDDSLSVLPWRQARAAAGTPWSPAAPVEHREPVMVPVAWLGRTSTEDSQDPTLSLPRQLNKSRAALPANWVIVAHYYDVESGRKDLDDRGHGVGHERFDIPIPRDGGIQDLLAAAERPDRPFAAVICESIERVARRTYFGTKIEYQLEKAGVTLCAADEPISTAGGGRKATPTLTRRVKQAVAEWYVLQMLELSWDGTVEHTRQGWNIGKPPYGYDADRIPHPVPARRAEGKSKTRLIPNPVRGPVVTEIFMLRAVNKLGWDGIADRLNLDLEKNPPPEPTRPTARIGRWTGSAVREVLRNPKYTGYMVYNRRDTKNGNKYNPPEAWIWSPHPTHEPLVTKDLYDAVAPIGARNERSRSVSTPNPSPETLDYELRTFIRCDICGRRMQGKPNRLKHVYYVCSRDARQHRDEPWYDEHPKSIWVREDAINKNLHEFFAQRVFGPHRRTMLEADLGDQVRAAAAAAAADAQGADQRRALAEMERRQSRLIEELESLDTGDLTDEDCRMMRSSIQKRFSEIGAKIRNAREELTNRSVSPAGPPPVNIALIDELPALGSGLAKLAPPYRRNLYIAYNLELRYNRNRGDLRTRICVTPQTMKTVREATQAAEGAIAAAGGDNPGKQKDARSAAQSSEPSIHLTSSPDGIRTRATALRGRRARPLHNGAPSVQGVPYGFSLTIWKSYRMPEPQSSGLPAADFLVWHPALRSWAQASS